MLVPLRWGLPVLAMFLGVFFFHLAGRFAYNLYNIAALHYIQQIDLGNEFPIPSEVDIWLRRSVKYGNQQAKKELERFQQLSGPSWPKMDSLIFWATYNDLHVNQWSPSIEKKDWGVVQKAPVRLQAEDMHIGGVQFPNRFVVVQKQGNIAYVRLYWRHNYLHKRLIIQEAGLYRITLHAQDWPPPPMRIRVDIDGQSEEFVWTLGDYQWRSQSKQVHLPRGIFTLRITYLTPQGNRTQNASIDYVELEHFE